MIWLRSRESEWLSRERIGEESSWIPSGIPSGNSLAASPLANSLAGFAREGNWRLRRRSPAHASRQLRRLALLAHINYLFSHKLQTLRRMRYTVNLNGEMSLLNTPPLKKTISFTCRIDPYEDNPTRPLTWGSTLNHSLHHANVKPFIAEKNSHNPRVFLVALHDIADITELLWNYNDEQCHLYSNSQTLPGEP